MNPNTLIMLAGGAALLWYFLSQNQTTTPTTTSTPATTTPAATTSTPVATVTPAANQTAPVVTSLNAASRQTAFLKSVVDDFNAGDPAITKTPNADGTVNYFATPYAFNYLLQHVADPSTAAISIPLDTIFPGVDLTQPMSAIQYWVGVGHWLVTGGGLSGLRSLGGLGSQREIVGVYHKGGWAV